MFPVLVTSLAVFQLSVSLRQRLISSAAMQAQAAGLLVRRLVDVMSWPLPFGTQGLEKIGAMIVIGCKRGSKRVL
jgi:hypothetical protein